MLQLRDMSIQRRLELILMLALSVALLLACIAFVVYDQFTFRKAMVRDLSTLAEVIERNSSAALAFGDSTDANDVLSAVNVRRSVVAASLSLADGTELARYLRPGTPVSGPRTLFEDGHVFTESHLEILRGVNHQGERIGAVWLRSDLTELHGRLRRYVVIVAGVLLAAMLIAFALSARLLKTVSAPILDLAETARRVSGEKNYSLRATPHGRDELGILVEGFNEMLARVQDRDAELQKAHDELEERVEERTRALREEVAERQQAEKAIEQQVTRLSLLNRITCAVSERQDLHSILNAVLQELERHLPTDFGGVLLLERESGMLKSIAVRCRPSPANRPPELPERSQAELEDSLLRSCLSGHTVYFGDTGEEEDPLTVHLAGLGLHSAVVAPLRVEENLFGLLVAGRRKAEAFGSGECEFLRMLSEEVALAAHQAKLYNELQTAYEELRQTQQAVMQHERLRALGQMASGIAHDINNTLSPVVGFTDLLLKNEDSLDEDSRRYIRHIRTAGQDIAHIVTRLREFYRRRDSGQDLKPVSLNELVLQVVDMTRPRWRDISQERGIVFKIETDLAEDLPEIAGIESELREALTNLVLNAVDASPKGGTIALRTRSEEWLPSGMGGTTGSQVILEVRDTGTGMDGESRRRCLEPFFSTKGARGTGLGLAMVYGVMERHEGRIEIDSEPGRGTVMRLVFPVREGRSEKPGSAVADEPDLPPLRVLFVDDEPLLRELVKELLESFGHDVTPADGGLAGLDAFRSALEEREPFDVVVTDLGMPHLDGRQLARAIRDLSPATPIIMLTGWGTFMKSDKDLPALVDIVLSKPPKMADLQAALRRVMSRDDAGAKPAPAAQDSESGE